MSGRNDTNTQLHPAALKTRLAELYVTPEVITSYSIRELRDAAARNAGS